MLTRCAKQFGLAGILLGNQGAGVEKKENDDIITLLEKPILERAKAADP